MQYVSQYLAEYMFLWTCRAVLENRRCVIELRNASKRYSCKSTPSASVLTNVYGVSTRSQSNSWWVNSTFFLMVIFDFTYHLQCRGSLYAHFHRRVWPLQERSGDWSEFPLRFDINKLYLKWKPGSFPSVWSKYHWDLTCNYLQNKKIQYIFIFF